MKEKVNDYIEFPKNSGYRSYHVVYKYKNNLNPSLLYRTTYSSESDLQPRYNIEIIWDGGYLYHFITFKMEGENLIPDHWEAMFNGKPLKDMSYIKFGLN